MLCIHDRAYMINTIASTPFYMYNMYSKLQYIHQLPHTVPALTIGWPVVELGLYHTLDGVFEEHVCTGTMPSWDWLQQHIKKTVIITPG